MHPRVSLVVEEPMEIMDSTSLIVSLSLSSSLTLEISSFLGSFSSGKVESSVGSKGRFSNWEIDVEESEKESEEGDEEEGDENESDERDDIESEEGDKDVAKTFNIDKFQVEMPIDDPTNLTGDFVVKSAMDSKFDVFRTILMDKKLEDFFKSSYFGYFLDLSEVNNARFQMSMVYDLLKRRIKYKGDDDDALENKNKKMDEI
ncbi:hypothetical protein H5410_023335 [Solanum commersonii]|uniref:Uncharacterized protein n=1 Tax=Solanum commersonii TaxID=4109 RepID=A0A9J5ZK09_SOLCO|nr:hypothetical protein H5410_023335 [Solanum commersonii]